MWEEFLFEFGFDAEKQKGEKKGSKDDAIDNQIEQETKNLRCRGQKVSREMVKGK